jgi:16S rRNA (guanine527-N7)-methyltransferase
VKNPNAPPEGVKELFGGLTQLQDADEDIKRITHTRLPEIAALLEKYIAEIELFNSAYGLVKVSGRRELVIKHILDSLAPLGVIIRCLEGRSPAYIADAGSGAGLPGIPLSIALPNHSFTLIERMGRRAGFLKNTIAVLELSNVTVNECEMEKAQEGIYDLVTFRAFHPLENRLVKNLFRLCNKRGMLAAYKGRKEKIKSEMSSVFLSEAPSPFLEIYPCAVPFLEEERNLLLMRQI